MSYDYDQNKIIMLDLSKELDNSKIVEDFIFEIHPKNFILDLNHEYKDIRVIWHYNKNWTLMKSNLQKECIKKGVKDEHIPFIEDTIDKNYNNITATQEKYDDEQQQQQEEEEPKEKEKTSLAQILVKLVLENHIKLLKDEFNVPHIVVNINDHYQTLPIDSTNFKRYLSKLYYDTYEGRITNTESINNAVSQLEAKATFEGQTIPLYLRVAWSNPATTDIIYYDLSDEKNSCIKITKDGWQIVENQTDVLFRRYNHFKPQVEPITYLLDDRDSKDSKMFNEFISLFNLKTNKDKDIEDIKLFLKCYVISLFIPEIQKPIKLLHGEQGGAKSTFQELVKMLVDPSATQTLTFPRDVNEFIQQLSHNYIAYYDNVSVIQDWISDLLCRAVTGSSFSKRALWTNDDDFYYNFKRIIGINGIDLAATKADLLDRSIILQTERIEKKDRVKIKKIWEKFNEIKPYVLGYIFDILAKVLRYKAEHGEIDFPDGLNRMADWEEYAEIISRCMGNKDGEFQRVYAENIGVQIDEAIESSPLSQAVLEFMNEEIIIGTDEATGNDIKHIREEWTGSPTNLHTELQNIAIGKLNLIVSKIKSWPKVASHLTRRINGIKTNLREKNIEITVGKENGKRSITICKVPSMPSMPSKTTESSTKQGKNLDSNPNNEQVPSKMPSTENTEKQAQNPDLDSKDSKDSILQTTKEDEVKKETLEEKYQREQQEEINGIEQQQKQKEQKKVDDVRDFMTINHLTKVAETEGLG